MINKSKEIILVQTCGACPEQYDAYYNNEVIGYLRLRHGYFRAEHMGEVVYEAHPNNSDGIFGDEEERKYHLKKARKAIKKEYNKRLLEE